MELPDTPALYRELENVKQKQRKRKLLWRIILPLGAASAVAVLVAILFLPILRIYGYSMTPTLYEHNIVVSAKTSDYKQGDVVSFYFNNSILVKRAIAFEGDWVDIDEEGNVFVNGKLIDEPYLTEKAMGNCTIDLPYQVPDGHIFVIGDHRETSRDSRSVEVGCIAKDKLVGRIVFRIWPLSEMGRVR